MPNSRVLVLGADFESALFALDLAKIGIEVTLLSAHEPYDWHLDLPQEGVFDAPGSVKLLIEELGETAVTTAPKPVYVRGETHWILEAERSVYGTPPYPLANEMISGVGIWKSLLAYLDRIKPVLTLGKTKSFEELVKKRIGNSAFYTFVQPQIAFKLGKESSQISVSEILPGFNEALTRAGSLTGAALSYQDRYINLASRVSPKAGWESLCEKILQKLSFYDVKIVADEDLFQEKLASAQKIVSADLADLDLSEADEIVLTLEDTASYSTELYVDLGEEKILPSSPAEGYSLLPQKSVFSGALKVMQTNSQTYALVRLFEARLPDLTEAQMQTILADLDSLFNIDVKSLSVARVRQTFEDFSSRIIRVREIAVEARREIAGIK